MIPRVFLCPLATRPRAAHCCLVLGTSRQSIGRISADKTLITLRCGKMSSSRLFGNGLSPIYDNLKQSMRWNSERLVEKKGSVLLERSQESRCCWNANVGYLIPIGVTHFPRPGNGNSLHGPGIGREFVGLGRGGLPTAAAFLQPMNGRAPTAADPGAVLALVRRGNVLPTFPVRRGLAEVSPPS